MKKEGSLKSILAILVIVLICLVSIGGIYVKDKNIMKNVLPEFNLGDDLNTRTIVKLDINKNEESVSDESNKSETEAENTETAESEKQNGQAENIYTADNYKKSKSIIEKRLKIAGVEKYQIRLNKSEGEIVVETPENIYNEVFSKGEVKIKIADSDIVLADNSNIKKVDVSTENKDTIYGSYSVVKLNFVFDKDTIKRFNEKKDEYLYKTNEDGSQTANNIEFDINDTAIFGTAQDTITAEEFFSSAVDGHWEKYVSGYSNDSKQIEQILKTANTIKAIVETEVLPIEYTIGYVEGGIVHSNINVKAIIGVFAIILAVMLVYLLFKYKLKGLFAEISIAGFGALLLFVLRISKVEISIASIVAIAAVLIAQFIYLVRLLSLNNSSSKKFNENMIEFTKMIIPAFIFSIVLAILPALKNMIPYGNIFDITGIGMVVFWGIILFEVFNNILTRAIFTNGKNK